MSEQIAVRTPDEMVRALDQLVSARRFPTRAAAVRFAVATLVDGERRKARGKAIVNGYLAHPQIEEEIQWARQAAVLSIAEEPW